MVVFIGSLLLLLMKILVLTGVSGLQLPPRNYIIELNTTSIQLSEHLSYLRRESNEIQIYNTIEVFLEGAAYAAYAAIIGPTLLQHLRLLQNATTEIVSIEEDIKLNIYETEKQPQAPWFLRRITQRRLPLQTQDYTFVNTSGQGTFIYVVDTGVDRTHVEFANQSDIDACSTSRVSLSGFTVFRNQFPTTDPNGHGTLVASIASGLTWGVTKKSQIVPVQVLDENGEGRISDIIRGLSWAINDIQQKKALGVSVINMSLGGGPSLTLNNLVNRAVAQGLIIVVAAGNEGVSACLESPSSSNAITVSAIDDLDRVPDFANTGSCVNIFAPGKDITGASIAGKPGSQLDPDPPLNCEHRSASIITESGTSFSASLVAGVLLLYMSYDQWILKKNTNDIAYTNQLKIKLNQQATLNVLQGTGRSTPNRLVYAYPPGLGVGQ